MQNSAPFLHPTTLPFRIFDAFSSARAGVLSYIDAGARSRALTLLEAGVLVGQLIVEDDEGTYVFGAKPREGREAIVLKVRSERLWSRIFFSHDMGLSEAYMLGEFDVSNLKEFFDLLLDNRASLASFSTSASSLFARYSQLAIHALGRQSLAMAKASVELAYDTSNEFFSCFLGKEMTYSGTIWGEEEGGVRGDLDSGPTPGDLEASGLRKIHLILKKARVRSGDRLLEIGSGWGAMAVEAAKLGCTVDTVTLSVEQKAMAEQRAAEAGVSDRVRVHLCDYRELPASFEHRFDAFVSCEMIEAVGARQLHEYFKMIDWAMKEDRATVVITATTQPEHRHVLYQPDDFARHYHWPNSYLPSATSLPVSVQEAVPRKFVFESVEDQGPHYCRTLREWGRRLEKNFKGDVLLHMQERYPQLNDPKNLEAFKRKWMYMFAYAEAGYASAYTSLHCWTFTRPENIIVRCS